MRTSLFLVAFVAALIPDRGLSAPAKMELGLATSIAEVTTSTTSIASSVAVTSTAISPAVTPSLETAVPDAYNALASPVVHPVKADIGVAISSALVSCSKEKSSSQESKRHFCAFRVNFGASPAHTISLSFSCPADVFGGYLAATARLRS